MKKVVIACLGIIFYSIFGCHKSMPATAPSGTFVEISPDSGNTALDFINATQVVVTGGALYNSQYQVHQTDAYKIEGSRIFFLRDSAAIADTTGFYLAILSTDTLELSTCPPGDFCPNDPYIYFVKH